MKKLIKLKTSYFLLSFLYYYYYNIINKINQFQGGYLKKMPDKVDAGDGAFRTIPANQPAFLIWRLEVNLLFIYVIFYIFIILLIFIIRYSYVKNYNSTEL